MADPGSSPRVLLGRYELTEPLGRGGMGEVWAGWDRRLQREVAVKLLRPELSAEPSFRERFSREATSAASLEHPTIVNVYDIDDDHGALFIVMERLPGPSLDQRLAQGPLSEEEVRRVADDMLSGLGAAHRAQLVHRDIKPGNLIRSAGGRWKVGDFGVAKDLAATATLTLAGVPVGTPAYLAPEQLSGEASTPATDLWAAAIVLREALTGVRPFPGEDPVSVAHAVRHTPLVPLRTLRPDLDPSLTVAVDRALSIDPHQRFASAEEMLAALEGRPVPAPAAPVPAPAAPVPPAVAPPAVAPPAPVAVAAAPPVAAAPVAPAPAPAPAVAHAAPPAAGPAAGSEPAGPATTTRRLWWLVAAAIGLMMVLLLVVLVGLAVGDDDTDVDPVPAPTSAPAVAGEPSTSLAPDAEGTTRSDDDPKPDEAPRVGDGAPATGAAGSAGGDEELGGG